MDQLLRYLQLQVPSCARPMDFSRIPVKEISWSGFVDIGMVIHLLIAALPCTGNF